MPKRRAIWIFAAILLMYPVSYLMISLKNGAYREIIYPKGEDPETRAYRFVCQTFWCPLENQEAAEGTSKKVLLAFYHPLTLLDRKFWHQSQESRP